MSEMTQEDRMWESMKGEITTARKTMIPIVPTIFLRVTQESSSGEWMVDQEPIYGIVHWQDDRGVSHYRYLTTGADEHGDAPGELDPYCGAGDWITAVVHPKLESVKDRIEMLKSVYSGRDRR